MFNIEKLDKSIKEHLGEITEEQEAVLQYAVNFPIILRLMTSDNWLTRDKALEKALLYLCSYGIRG